MSEAGIQLHAKKKHMSIDLTADELNRMIKQCNRMAHELNMLSKQSHLTWHESKLFPKYINLSAYVINRKSK